MKNKEAEFGDLIRIKTQKEVVEGILLEGSSSEFYLVKLKSGYNIGLRKENVVSIEVLRKSGKEKNRKITMKKNPKLPNVDIIMTGGTISGRLDPVTGGVKGLTDAGDFFRFYPEIFEVANINRVEVPFMVLSENMNYKHWKKIAMVVEKSLNNPDISGVILTQGTDTLHYTAAALSFFFPKLNKPIVLTYSQRSTDRASSDASLNLKCAARIAAKSDICEVVVVGHGSVNDDFCYVFRGTKVRKMHSSRRDTFHAINQMPLAKVWPDRDKIEKLSEYKVKEQNNEKPKSEIVFNPKIALIKSYPGQEPDILEYYMKNYEAVVIEGTGFGHVATSESEFNWIPKIKKAIYNGLLVFMTTQTPGGRTDPYVYSAGRELLKAGVIFLEDMLPETAFVKLGWVLGHKNWRNNQKKIKEKMLENLRGELNDRLLLS